MGKKDRECLGKKVNDLVTVLDRLVASYRLLVGAAEEFNRITPAHADDVDDAIDRADDLGDVIDDIIDTLEDVVDDWLDEVKKDKCEKEPPPLLPPGEKFIIETED